jgi:hypothetical protein
MKTWLTLFAALAISGLQPVSAQAVAIPAGDDIIIIGTFASAQLRGNIVNDPAVGQLAFRDNTNSAVFAINNPTNPDFSLDALGFQQNGSSIQWGTNTPDAFSLLTFLGKKISAPANLTQDFVAGKFKLENGTSTLDSIIFGATLKFAAHDLTNPSVPDVDLGDPFSVVINTTRNFGVDPALDQDYINVCGNYSNLCGGQPVSLEAPEGAMRFANLHATIVGDPQIILQALTSDQDGAIGSRPPLALLVPEPASWTVLIIGFGFIIALRAAISTLKHNV